MSNYEWLIESDRKKHLVIVEGDHEKNNFIKELLISFPEIDMKLDDASLDLIYDSISFVEILKKQNALSHENKEVWVLNSSAMFVADYNIDYIK